MRLLAFIATLLPFISLPLRAAEIQSKRPMVKAPWIIKMQATATEDAKTDRGSVNLPIITTAECESRFKIERLTFSLDTADLARHLSGIAPLATLEIRIIKLFQGRGATPDIILEQGGGKRAGFSFFNAIDVNEWPRKNYRFGAKFDAGKLMRPQHWKQLELKCN